MKKISLLVLLTTISFCSFSQVKDEPVKPMLKADYLKKSRNQKITAWVLFGTGAIINIVGISKVDEPDSPLGYFIAGSAIMLSSIPFTVMAHKNKKKAMALGFNNKMIQQVTGNNYIYKPVPSITLKIKL